MVAIPVVDVDGTVGGAVNVHTLQRTAIGTVNLLVHEKRVGRVPHRLNLDGVARATGNAAHEDTNIGWVRYLREVRDLVFIIGHVETHVEAQAFFLNGGGVDCKFNAPVLQIAHVGQNLIGQVRTRRHGNDGQEVFGLLIVEVYATRNTSVKQRVVDGGVERFGLFPLQVGIVAFGP